LGLPTSISNKTGWYMIYLRNKYFYTLFSSLSMLLATYTAIHMRGSQQASPRQNCNSKFLPICNNFLAHTPSGQNHLLNSHERGSK
jgi:hypothetical protein